MRFTSLLREALATTWAAKVASALVVAVVAGMCFAAVATVGRSASAVSDVAERLERAGARRLTVIDTKGQGFINESTLGVLNSVSTVESAHALGTPFDTVNGAIGAGGLKLPVWSLLGDTSTAVEMVRGRAPAEGEAIISVKTQRRLLLTEPLGYLTTLDGARQFPIVGAYEAGPALNKLDAGALVNVPDSEASRELVVTIVDTAAATATVQAVLSVLAPPAQDDVAIESPTGLAATARQLEADLASQGRSLLLLILGVGGLFVAAVVLADVLVRRRDLGRRRTLGVTRTDLVAMVTVRCLITGALGACVGTFAAVVTNRMIGFDTPPQFALGVAVLGLLVAAVAAVAPALYASRLDPVDVMRVA